MNNSELIFTGRLRTTYSRDGYIEGTNVIINSSNLYDALDRDTVKYRYIEPSFYEKNNFPSKQTAEVVEVVKRFRTEFVVEIKEVHPHITGVFFTRTMSEAAQFLNYDKAFVGEKVLARILYFDKETCSFTVEAVKSLGHKTHHGVDLSSIIHDLNIATEFSQNALKDIEKLKCLVDDLKKTGKFKDFTDKAFFTVDPPDSKDFDDSICVEKISDGKYQAYVAIADVWSYLKEYPGIEEDAIKRGTSFYLINSVIPMLPHDLSNNYCSLVEKEERNTLVVSFKLDTENYLDEKSIDIFPAIIKSQKRFTYTEVNEYFEKPEVSKDWDESLKNSVDWAEEGFQILDDARNKRGYLQINKHENKFNVDENSDIESIYVYKSGKAQKLIEHFMVAANVAVAEFFFKRKIQTIFRFHDAPKPEKIDHLVNDSVELNLIIPKYERKNLSVNVLNEWVNLNSKSTDINLVKNLLLHCMQKAVYDTQNMQHFGLNLSCYLHFTSPIRRLADLIVHKLLWMNIFDPDSYTDSQRANIKNSLVSLAHISTETESRASEAENTLNKIKIFKYLLKKYKNTTAQGQVVSKNKHGFFVRIDDIYEVYVKTNLKIKLGVLVIMKYCDTSEEFTFIKNL